MGQETKSTQTIIDGNKYDTALGIGIAIKLFFISIACDEGTSMDPKCDRQFVALLCVSRFPDIQIETILTHLGVAFREEFLHVIHVAIIVDDSGIGACHMRWLERDRTKMIGNQYSIPCDDGLWSLPAQLAHRRSGIRDALEDDNIGILRRHTLYFASCHFFYQRVLWCGGACSQAKHHHCHCNKVFHII